MPISIIDNFDVNAPKNIDGRLGPYDTTASAKAAIDETTQRYFGLTIVVTGSGNLEEYWFQDGITDSDLVLKPGGSSIQTGSFMVTGSVTDNTLTFTKGDGTTFDLIVDTGSSGVSTLQEVVAVGSSASSSSPIILESTAGSEYSTLQLKNGTFLSGSTTINIDYLNGFNVVNSQVVSLGTIGNTISVDFNTDDIRFNFNGITPSEGDIVVAKNINGDLKFTASSAVGAAGTLQEVLDAGSIGSASGDMLIKQGDRQIYFDQTDESIYLNSTGSAGMGGVFLTAENTAINHSASIDVVEGTINFKGTDLGSPTPGDVLVARTVNGGIKWTGSNAITGGNTQVDTYMYSWQAGTDSTFWNDGNISIKYDEGNDDIDLVFLTEPSGNGDLVCCTRVFTDGVTPSVDWIDITTQGATYQLAGSIPTSSQVELYIYHVDHPIDTSYPRYKVTVAQDSDSGLYNNNAIVKVYTIK